MDEAAILSALRQYWMSQYAEPFRWEDDETPDPVEEQSVRIVVRPEGAERVGVGRTREELRGLVMVTVKTPRSLGPGPGERKARDVAALWRAFRNARIKLSAPSVVGLTPDGAFNRHLVTLGWRGDMRFAAQ